MQVKKQQLELDMEQWTGTKFGKEYVKGKYCYSAYLTFFKFWLCHAACGVLVPYLGIKPAPSVLEVKSLSRV